MSIAAVAVKMGKAKTTRTIVAKDAQTKIGIFISVMPGQRIFKIVTKKVNPRKQAPHSRDLHAPYPIIDPYTWIILDP